ncbi:response regulator [Dyadobacter fermentans]|uniref:Two component transcriptional regulator, LytTR family n=1 Tax=Dyadobacter fermentans (strain ATCC 700827 / DSM 18053 / CIP 107007 / KCTC 52180 / NS114) TaxID=471854 RepID=C6VSQ0_DYAFD|nr:response regulator [Dyadobacter fermentans]ACT92872.1 two component transcriptional regulator, LytTR family [Dyadobacter fermentans DSM 18053]
MPPLRILIVEDIVLTALDLRNSLEKNGYVVTAIARNMEEVRQAVVQTLPDLALIDIILEGSDASGIEIAQYLTELRPIPIIYLTANSEEEQFRKAQLTRPAAYLLKPFRISDVIFNVELAYHNFKAADHDPERHLMLPTNGGLELVDLDEVAYLKAAGAYTEVVLADGTTYLVSSGLGQTGLYFRGANFFRLSRSFVVNIQYIKRVKEGELLLRDGITKISLPDGARKELLNKFTILKTKQPK